MHNEATRAGGRRTGFYVDPRTGDENRSFCVLSRDEWRPETKETDRQAAKARLPSAKKTPPESEARDVTEAIAPISGHHHSNMTLATARQKQASMQAIREEARALGIPECQCAHMAIPELQEEIERKKQEIAMENFQSQFLHNTGTKSKRGEDKHRKVSGMWKKCQSSQPQRRSGTNNTFNPPSLRK